jgi:uncharacterized repeat protein (TIGR01451 family)
VKALLATIVAAACLTTTGAAAPRLSTWPSPIDQIVSRCPTAAEIAAIRSEEPISVETTPGPLVCTAAAGSADLDAVQERTYQALLVMRTIRFSQPLPWTSLTLWDWFRSVTRGVRVKDLPFGTGGYCCDPAGVIVSGNTGFLDVNRWADPARNFNAPVYPLITTFVHEARHAEGPVHECPPDDNTISELGAWGVQYYLEAWMALFTGDFLTSPDIHPALYRDVEIYRAGVWRIHGCQSPFADLQVSVRDTPDPVVTGGLLTYLITVRNAGPSDATGVLLYEDVPLKTTVTAISSSRGSCSALSDTRRGSLGCRLGSLAVGAAATVRIVYRVHAPAGTRLRNVERQGVTYGTVALSEDREPAGPARTNHIVSVTTLVKAKPKPKPKPKKR